MSAFLAFLEQWCEIEAGFTCDRTADWITGGREGGATLSIALSEVVIGSPGRLPGDVDGLNRVTLEEQGLTLTIMSSGVCYWREILSEEKKRKI